MLFAFGVGVSITFILVHSPKYNRGKWHTPLPKNNWQHTQGTLVEAHLEVSEGKVGIGLLDHKTNTFVGRKFVDAGFVGKLELLCGDCRQLTLVVESGETESGGTSTGSLRKVTMRPFINCLESAAFPEVNSFSEDVSLGATQGVQLGRSTRGWT